MISPWEPSWVLTISSSLIKEPHGMRRASGPSEMFTVPCVSATCCHLGSWHGVGEGLSTPEAGENLTPSMGPLRCLV